MPILSKLATTETAEACLLRANRDSGLEKSRRDPL
jgi:hypothetical protein